MPLVIQVEDLLAGTSAKTAFGKSPVRLGRSELNDLVLPQPFVSQWHAQVEFDDARMEYVDLGSTNGSTLGTQPIQRKVPVAIDESAEIRIGALRLTFARRATVEAKGPPRTLFAVRAATALGIPAVNGPALAATPPPSRLAGARAAPGPAERPRSVAVHPAAVHGLPAVAPPAPAAPSGASRPSATPAPARSHLPPPAQPAPGPGVRLDLPTEFRMPAVSSPSVTAPPLPEEAPASRPSPGSGPALDLPTEFRLPAAATPEPRPAGASPAVRRFEVPAAAPGPAVPATAPCGGGREVGPGPGEIDLLVATFAESYLPSSVRIGGAADLQVFLARLAEALEAFARGFVEMRKGYEEFGKQMGVRTVHGEGPVHRARDAAQLLAALLDPGQQGRAGDLQAAFADHMVHHVALLGGVSEGAKAMLATLSPEALEAEAPKSVWPMKGQALWKIFEERFHELYDEEGTISEALFGRDFGRAYVRIIGRRGAVEPDDGEDDDPEQEDERDKSRTRRTPHRR